MFRPIGTVFSTASIFFLGVGVSYLCFYSHLMIYLDKSDELMKSELHSLKRAIVNSQLNEGIEKGFWSTINIKKTEERQRIHSLHEKNFI